MPIKLPKEIAYFYEITHVADRLYYCIPQKQLHSMIEQGKVRENIIEDYPDGVDIKVSPIQYREFQECYGMTFNIDPRLTWKAFQFVKSKIRNKYFGTGFIASDFLEENAKQILSYLKQTIEPLKVDLEPLAVMEQKRVQRRMRLSEQKLEIELKKIPIKNIDPKKPITEQFFSKIEMSGGDEPFDFLSRYQLKQKEEK